MSEQGIKVIHSVVSVRKDLTEKKIKKNNEKILNTLGKIWANQCIRKAEKELEE